MQNTRFDLQKDAKHRFAGQNMHQPNYNFMLDPCDLFFNKFRRQIFSYFRLLHSQVFSVRQFLIVLQLIR